MNPLYLFKKNHYNCPNHGCIHPSVGVAPLCNSQVHLDFQDCVSDVASAYDLLTAVNDGKADASVAPKVAALLIRAAEKRTSKDKISASG